MDFIPFQEFEPREQAAQRRCIWCGGTAPTNRAHIVSRKLSSASPNTPTLRMSVCASCNSACGKLEEWVLRFTPLSWVRFMSYLQPGADASSHHVPSYFFSEVFKDWIVFHMDGKSRSYIVATQLILFADAEVRLITQLPTEAHQDAVSAINAALQTGSYDQDIRPSLPVDFGPRLLLVGKVVLVARRASDAQRLLDSVSQLGEASSAKNLLSGNTGDERHHFQWSRVTWGRFSAKVALEALCLFEGQSKCLNPAFDGVRKFVLQAGSPSPKELVFSNLGPTRHDDIPLPVTLDLTVGQSAPESIAALTARCDSAMHLVLLYEICGWVLATVVFGGFPASIFVLAGPDEHLDDIYQMIYDDETSVFHFAKLAFDPRKPVIEFPIAGGSMTSLSETYKLKAV